MTTRFILRPEHIAPFRNVSLRARQIVEGMIAGFHKSPYHGFSAEFLEYRAYQPGESAGAIDWRLYAKTDRSYVRLFEDETNLHAQVMVDKSASMGFAAEGRESKFDYACTLAAAFAWILIHQRDAVAVAAFDETVTSYLPPRSTNVQLQNILTLLNGIEASSATRCGKAINMLAHGIKRAGLTIVLSDLLDEPESIMRGLRHLRFKRQDVLVLWLLDPQECSFSARNAYRLQDMENGNRVMLDGAVAAEHLSRGMAEHRQVLERGCRELRIDFAMVMTNEPYADTLVKILRKRRQKR